MSLGRAEVSADDGPPRVGLVLVSHVAAIAQGVAVLAGQMAQDVAIAAAAGTDDGGIGTSFDLVQAGLLEAERGAGVVVLYDLGSALLTSESAVELLDGAQRARVRIVDAPLVEGALAAAVRAQGGGTLAEVAEAAVAANRAGTGDGAGVAEAAVASNRAGTGDGAGVAASTERAGRIATGDVAGSVEPAPGQPGARRVLTLVNELGLHLRPAAALVRALAGLDARVALSRPGEPPVDARSLLGVVGLGLRGGDELEVRAAGPDAHRALEAVSDQVNGGFDEGGAGARATTGSLAASAAPGGAGGRFDGTGVSPGTAIGPTLRLRQPEIDVGSFADRQREPAVEDARLTAALDEVRREIHAIGGELADAHAMLLDDAALLQPARAAVAAGLSAELAWWRAVESARAALAAGDELAAGRAADVSDLGLRVLAGLDPAIAANTLPPAGDLRGAVVVAEDVLPSQVQRLAAAESAGLVTAAGSRTAHASLVARGLGLPMVAAAGRAILDIPDRTPAVLEAAAGELLAPATRDQIRSARDRANKELATREAQLAAARLPVVLSDGRQVVIGANVASATEARAALVSGADAIGLLRTELLFLDQRTPPSEDEQVARLSQVLAEFPGRRVTIRTFDVGGDKPLPWLRLDARRHGFLGQRGLRYGLGHLEEFRTHVRAVLRAAAMHDAEIALMAPMVTYADEVQAFRELVDAAAAELVAANTAHRRPDALGIMVEVPAAALAIDQVAAGLDFVSVGSNDLLQYLAAAERTLPEVGFLYRPEAVAVWRTLERLIDDARSAGAAVAVCGEMAEDPRLARRLVDLGVDELSVPPGRVPEVKAALRPANQSGAARAG